MGPAKIEYARLELDTYADVSVTTPAGPMVLMVTPLAPPHVLLELSTQWLGPEQSMDAGAAPETCGK